MRKFLVIFLALAVLLCACGPADAPQEAYQTEATEAPTTETTELPVTEETAPPAEPLDLSSVQAYIDTVAEKYGAIGVQVAVINDGEVADSFACGWATVEEDPMTEDHKIRVASLSKVILGMATMALEEEGIVDLDESIGKYWDVTAQNPYYPDSTVSIRTILSHTSSIADYGDGCSKDAYSIRYRLHDGYIYAKPGDISGYYYNNYGFQVLGATLELAADQTMDTILREKFFSAMDIDGGFGAGELQNPNLLATLYYEDGWVARSVETAQSLYLSEYPGENGAYFSGGLTISAKDLAKLVALLAADGVYNGQRLLSEASVETMETCLTEALSDGSYQAHPLFYAKDLYQREGLYYHVGSAYGAYNCLSYDPVSGDGVVVLTVGAGGSMAQYEIFDICHEINQYIYDLIG